MNSLVGVALRLNACFLGFRFFFFFDLFLNFILIFDLLQNLIVRVGVRFICVFEWMWFLACVFIYMSVDSSVVLLDDCCFCGYTSLIFISFVFCYESLLYESRRRKPGWRFIAGPSLLHESLPLCQKAISTPPMLAVCAKRDLCAKKYHSFRKKYIPQITRHWSQIAKIIENS